MDRIQWSEKFSVGVKALDEQHQQIIGMLNRLVSTPEAEDANSETVSEILTTMTRYSLEHFKTEEGLMKAHGYPDLVEHRQEHIAYRRKAIDFSTASSLGVESVPQILVTYLMDWWTHHILEEDMKYKSFFAEKGVG
jgi:hemerythrin-like metal-binding protein